MVATWVGKDHQNADYRGRLRTTRVALMAKGLG